MPMFGHVMKVHSAHNHSAHIHSTLFLLQLSTMNKWTTQDTTSILHDHLNDYATDRKGHKRILAQAKQAILALAVERKLELPSDLDKVSTFWMLLFTIRVSLILLRKLTIGSTIIVQKSKKIPNNLLLVTSNQQTFGHFAGLSKS